MDWSFILSIVAIVVSVVVSVITLLLTELQGPDIALISDPEFEVDYQRMSRRRKEHFGGSIFSHVPTVLESKPATFVFANHGKKAGTILSLNFEFLPSENFQGYFRVFDPKLTLSPEEFAPSQLKMPITIEAGTNTVFFVLANVLILE
jgi:hypothetical protein